MADQYPTLSSFPPRPLSMIEIEALEERDRIQSIITTLISAFSPPSNSPIST